MVLPEGLNMQLENIRSYASAGLGSSSGVNFGQRNVLRQGNANHEDGDSSQVSEQIVPPSIKKSYKRHTKEHLQKLEAFFEECPHPSEGQKRRLALELELEPDQIRFWFQNKRTQLKGKYVKNHKTVLREENEKLKEQNLKLEEAHNNPICTKCICSNPPREMTVEVLQLIVSNSILKEKLQKLQEQPATSKGKAPLVDLTSVSSPLTPHLPEQNDFLLEQYNRLLEGQLQPIQKHLTLEEIATFLGVSPPLTPHPSEQNDLLLEQYNILEDQLQPIQEHVTLEDITTFPGVRSPPTPHPPEQDDLILEQYNLLLEGKLEPIQEHVTLEEIATIFGVSPPLTPHPSEQNDLLLEQYNLLEDQLQLIQEHVTLEDIATFPGVRSPPTPHPPEQDDLILEQYNLLLEGKFEPIQEHVTLEEIAMILGVSPPSTPHPSETNGLQHLLMGDTFGPVDIQEPVNRGNKEMLFDLGVSAMTELMAMARSDGPLWCFEEISSSFVLNKTEYSKVFPKEIGSIAMGFRTEASKDTALVLLSSKELVKVFMDETQWSTVFSGVVASATTLEILLAGERSTYHGALHLMKAEFQVLSPIVRTRESHFLRYCWNHNDGSWTVTDISLEENWEPNNTAIRCRRQPSGCLIEDTPDGYSKVTWVEHVEVYDLNSLNLYTTFIHSGLAFGAKRWITILKRHCQYLVSTMESTPGDEPITIIPMHGIKAMLKLAKRMMVSFHNGVNSSTAQRWNLLSDYGFPNIRLMVRKSISDPGHPTGTVLSASSSFFLPIPHVRVFGYLRNHQCRHQWDPLANGQTVKEVANVPDGDEEWNSFSLLRVYSPSEDHSAMFLLQESQSDQTGSFITYTYVYFNVIKALVEGRDPYDLPLLPSGFAIFPDGSISETGSRACLVTISLQLLLSSNPDIQISKDMVTPISNLIDFTIGRIKDSLDSQNA